jgi:Peptidase A4 family
VKALARSTGLLGNTIIRCMVFGALVVTVTIGTLILAVGHSAAATKPEPTSAWAGFVALDTKSPDVSGAISSWTVPQLVCSAVTNSKSAVWVGIGGYYPAQNSELLSQVGTEQDCVDGSPRYAAFDEANVDGQGPIAFLGCPTSDDEFICVTAYSVQAGDVIRAQVAMEDLLGHHYTRWWVTDYRHGAVLWHHTSKFLFNSVGRHSAECVVEDPRHVPFSDFGTVIFSSCKAQQSGGRLFSLTSSLPTSWTVKRPAVASNGNVLAASSSSSLTVTYLPQRAAQSLSITRSLNWTASGVVVYGPQVWLTVSQPDNSSVLSTVYEWLGSGWKARGSIATPGGFIQGSPDTYDLINAALLTGSSSPNFVVHSTSADTFWISVLAYNGDKWFAVPFDDSNGTSTAETTAPPQSSVQLPSGVQGDAVLIGGDPCGCSTGPLSSTWLDVYQDHQFVPKGAPDSCAGEQIAVAAYQYATTTDQAENGIYGVTGWACSSGFAIATVVDATTEDGDGLAFQDVAGRWMCLGSADAVPSPMPADVYTSLLAAVNASPQNQFFPY